MQGPRTVWGWERIDEKRARAAGCHWLAPTTCEGERARGGGGRGRRRGREGRESSFPFLATFCSALGDGRWMGGRRGSLCCLQRWVLDASPCALPCARRPARQASDGNLLGAEEALLVLYGGDDASEDVTSVCQGGGRAERRERADSDGEREGEEREREERRQRGREEDSGPP